MIPASFEAMRQWFGAPEARRPGPEIAWPEEPCAAWWTYRDDGTEYRTTCYHLHRTAHEAQRCGEEINAEIDRVLAGDALGEDRYLVGVLARHADRHYLGVFREALD